MLHIERLKNAIETLSRLAVERRQQRESDVSTALRWLRAAPGPDALRSRLAPLTAGEHDWPGALPMTDAQVNARFTTTGDPPRGAVLIGVDGSQIYPDPHAAVLYYLIQIGGLAFRYDGSRPSARHHESLHFADDELYDDRGYLISAERVGMQRLVQEIGYLADLVAMERQVGASALIVALTDGPLLWPYVERNRADYLALQAYLEAVSRIRHEGGLPVGYVARPGGRPLVELLWAAQLSPEDIPGKLDENPLRLLTDLQLMAHFLQPGERSAWFSRPSATNQRQAGHGHEVWFCYVNVGRERGPVISRVEVPAWGAADEGAIAALHAMLRHQSDPLNGYPYILARAHEEALVTTQDKAALDNEIQRRLFEQGILAQPSEKAQQKAFLGRR